MTIFKPRPPPPQKPSTPILSRNTLRIPLITNLATPLRAPRRTSPVFPATLSPKRCRTTARRRVRGLRRNAATPVVISTCPDRVLADVGIRVRGDSVDPEAQGRVVGVVQTGDLDHGAGLATSAAADLNLGALEVELGIAALCAVQGNVLDPDEVLAGGRVAGEGEGDGCLVVGTPVLVVLWFCVVSSWGRIMAGGMDGRLTRYLPGGLQMIIWWTLNQSPSPL